MRWSLGLGAGKCQLQEEHYMESDTKPFIILQEAPKSRRIIMDQFPKQLGE